MRRARRPGIAFLGLGLMAVLACQRPPLGPGFEPAARPASHRARLYFYRSDSIRSLASVRVELDGRDLGTLDNEEYGTIEVAPGPHRFRAGLRSATFVAWGWNSQPLRLEPGETVFIRLSVRLSEHGGPVPGSAVEIPGRAAGMASENVFIERRGEDDALEELSRTTLGRP